MRKNVPMILSPIRLFPEMVSINIQLYVSITNCTYEINRIIYLLDFSFYRLVNKNLKDSKVGRGVNLVAFDGKTFDMKLIETFDTYLEGK